MPLHEELFVSQEAIDQATQDLLAAREADHLARFDAMRQEAAERTFEYMRGPEFQAFVGRQVQKTLDRHEAFREAEKAA